MIRTKALLMPLGLALALGLAACAPASSSAPGHVDGDSASQATDAESGDADGTDSEISGAVDSDGFIVPGQVAQLELGDSVTYYSLPKLSKDDAQKVTIHSVEYIEKGDLPGDAPHDKFDTGVMVVSLSWESVMGSVQSNQGYLVAELDSGGRGIPLAFRDDRLRNGGVPGGESQTGTFTIALDRGPTTLTLVDYADVPVARLKVDTSS